MRLWRWEQFKGYLAPADVHLCMTPQPWERTGPGLAKDGKPRFDLTKLDAGYFDRLHDESFGVEKDRDAGDERPWLHVRRRFRQGVSSSFRSKMPSATASPNAAYPLLVL